MCLGHTMLPFSHHFLLIFQGGGETTPLERLNMCFVPTLISHFCHFHCFYLKKSSELAVAGAWKIKAKWPHCMPPSVKTYVYYCLLNRATQVIKFLGIMKWLYLGFITWPVMLACMAALVHLLAALACTHTGKLDKITLALDLFIFFHTF